MRVVNVSPMGTLHRAQRLFRARSPLFIAIIVIGTMLVTSVGVPAAPVIAQEPTATPEALAPAGGSVQQQQPEQPAPPEGLAPQERTVVPNAPTIPSAVTAKITTAVEVQAPSGPVQPGAFGLGHVAYSPKGSSLALGTAFGVYLYDTESRQSTGRIDTGGAVSSIAYSPDGGLLAAGSSSNSVQIWQADGGSLIHTMQAPAGQVNWVAFSPDGSLLAVASSDAQIRLWNVADGALAQTLTGHNGPISSVAFSPNGEFVVSGAADGSVRVWSVQDGIATNSVVGAQGGVSRVAFSADGSTVAFGSGDGTVRLWQVNGGQVPTTLAGHLGAVTDLAFMPGDSLVASASTDGTVRLWQVTDGQLIAILPGNIGPLSSISFRPDGRRLIAFSYGGEFRLWNLSALFPAACTDGAAFVVDVTVPNNTVIAPGAPFQKVWRVQNVGSCPWSDRYQLVFASGTQLSAIDAQPLTTVAPGNTLDIAVDMVAPAEPGIYQAVWQIVDPNGQPFGPGLTVIIQSGTPGPAVYITASATYIDAGQSVTIQATVIGTVQAWLDGEPIFDGFAQKTVWLCGTTTFTVDGMLSDGSHITQSVTVNVNGSCNNNEADLRIKELNASNTNPVVGEVVHFSARVKNEGDESADDFDLKWRPSSSSSYSTKGKDLDLDPGDDEWVDWNYTFNSPGTYETRARIEYNDEETHRSLTIVVSGSATPTPTPTPGAADVVMTGLTADDTAPQAGQVVHFTATLHNQGSGTATNYRLVWRPSDATAFQLISGSVNLNSGETQNYDFDYTYTQAGTYNTTAVVTSGGQPVLEDSNYKTLEITVSSIFPTPTPGTPTPTPTVGPAPAGNPNLVVTALAANPSSPAAGEVVHFTASVQNQGDGPAYGFQTLWRPDSSAAFQLQSSGLNLEAGQSLLIAFDYTFTAEGTYETEEVAEFASVRGLSASAVTGSNSRTLTVVVGPSGSSLLQLGTATPTITSTVAPPEEATLTPTPEETVVTEPTETSTVIPEGPTATPTAEETVVTEPTATPMPEQPTATPTTQEPVVTEPTSTSVPEEPTATPTAVAPVVTEPTATTVPDEPTVTPISVEPTATVVTAEPTSTPVPAEPTAAQVPAEPTATPVPAEPTATPVPAEPTATPVPPKPTATQIVQAPPAANEPTATPIVMSEPPTATPTVAAPPLAQKPAQVQAAPTATPAKKKPSRPAAASKPTLAPSAAPTAIVASEPLQNAVLSEPPSPTPAPKRAARQTPRPKPTAKPAAQPITIQPSPTPVVVPTTPPQDSVANEAAPAPRHKPAAAPKPAVAPKPATAPPPASRPEQPTPTPIPTEIISADAGPGSAPQESADTQ